MNLVGKAFRKMAGYVEQKLHPVAYARKLGVTVGENCILGSFRFGSEPWLITLGNHVEITGNVTFITHDGATWVLRQDERYRRVLRYGKITIGDNVLIGYGSILLPGVTIGENVIVGAGSVVTKDIPPNTVAAGKPARKISGFKEYAEKCLGETPDYEEENYRRNKREEVLRVWGGK